MLKCNFISFIVVTTAICFLSIFLVYTVGRSDRLTCKRLEWHYTQCQYQHRYFYGMWSEETLPFKIQGADTESYTYQDSDGYTITAYVLYLRSGTERIKFHDYGRRLDRAQADIERIHDVMSGFAAPDLQIDHSQWGKDFPFITDTNIFGSFMSPGIVLLLGWIARPFQNIQRLIRSANSRRRSGK
jgi:hypothetical protein